jgi:DNA-binding transcriptional regulator LsrR (DeoR family)
MRFVYCSKRGPSQRFNDYHVYKALSFLSDGRHKGRKELANSIGVGEGSMRTIIEALRNEGLINVDRSGVRISKLGLSIFQQIPLRQCLLSYDNSATNPSCSVAVHIKNAAVWEGERAAKPGDDDTYAEELSSRTAPYGGVGALIDLNLNVKNPGMARKIRRLFDLEEGDVIIISTSTDFQRAEEASLTAALEII